MKAIVKENHVQSIMFILDINKIKQAQLNILLLPDIRFSIENT